MLLPLASVGADERMSLMQDLGYQGAGVLIVLGALSFLAIVLSIMGRAFVNSAAKPSATSAVPAQPAVSSSPVAALPDGAAGPSPEVRAAIVAAVYHTVGAHARVLDIQSAHPELAAWSMEGRRQIFLSHRVR
jgi:sodium pump decarboxylase gamma subunit